MVTLREKPDTLLVTVISYSRNGLPDKIFRLTNEVSPTGPEAIPPDVAD
jgi:hypothetical protein